MDYICYRVDEIADMVEDKEIADLLHDLSDLLHDEEWYKSGDTGRNDYLKSLRKFKKKWFKGSRNERLEKYLRTELDRLKSEIHDLL